MIDWRPMIELPQEAKDGRQMLLWHERLSMADIGTWDGYSGAWEIPTMQTGRESVDLTSYSHFAVIQPPAGTNGT
jgi:hypothetical protein